MTWNDVLSEVNVSQSVLLWKPQSWFLMIFFTPSQYQTIICHYTIFQGDVDFGDSLSCFIYFLVVIKSLSMGVLYSQTWVSMTLWCSECCMTRNIKRNPETHSTITITIILPLNCQTFWHCWTRLSVWLRSLLYFTIQSLVRKEDLNYWTFLDSQELCE